MVKEARRTADADTPDDGCFVIISFRCKDGDVPDDIEDTCGVAVALPFGSFSDPEELQVWPWRGFVLFNKL